MSAWYFEERGLFRRWESKIQHGDEPHKKTVSGRKRKIRRVTRLAPDVAALALRILRALADAETGPFAPVSLVRRERADQPQPKTAVIEHPDTGALVRGRIVERHENGDVTIDFAGMLRARGYPFDQDAILTHERLSSAPKRLEYHPI